MFRLPILTYHSIDSTGSVLSTSPEIFQGQLEFLASEGYQTISLSDAMTLLQGKARPPHPAIVLTFDDGYVSVYDVALPLMRELRFKGTVFLVTDYLGLDNGWPRQPNHLPRFPILTRSQVQELADQGWELAGHSATHERLPGLNQDDLKREIERCYYGLSKIAVQPVEWFAYPFGFYNSRVQDMVRKFFRGACSVHLAFATPNSDPFALERIDTYYLRRLRIYQALQSDWLVSYLRLRRVLRKVRARE